MSISETHKNTNFDSKIFGDLLVNNKSFVSNFEHEELTGTAKEGLAIITCMDSRISPLAVVGMKPGDAKILRNAGARVTDDVLRTLVLASYLLGVKRILVMPHTDCRMANGDEADIHNEINAQYGIDTSSIDISLSASFSRALILYWVMLSVARPLVGLRENIYITFQTGEE